MKEIIVTSYPKPDLDGVAASYAYSEFLQKSGQMANYSFESKPKKEVAIVCDLFNISLTSCSPNKENSFVVVDTNTIKDFPSFVEINNVIEIIDHHVPSQDIPKFSSTKVQIEMIGAVATLIAEKFYQNHISISRNSAILLYYAIISNSINLHSRNLYTPFSKTENYIKNYFEGVFENGQLILKPLFMRKEIIKLLKEKNL